MKRTNYELRQIQQFVDPDNMSDYDDMEVPPDVILFQELNGDREKSFERRRDEIFYEIEQQKKKASKKEATEPEEQSNKDSISKKSEKLADSILNMANYSWFNQPNNSSSTKAAPFQVKVLETKKKKAQQRQPEKEIQPTNAQGNKNLEPKAILKNTEEARKDWFRAEVIPKRKIQVYMEDEEESTDSVPKKAMLTNTVEGNKEMRPLTWNFPPIKPSSSQTGIQIISSSLDQKATESRKAEPTGLFASKAFQLASKPFQSSSLSFGSNPPQVQKPSEFPKLEPPKGGLSFFGQLKPNSEQPKSLFENSAQPKSFVDNSKPEGEKSVFDLQKPAFSSLKQPVTEFLSKPSEEPKSLFPSSFNIHPQNPPNTNSQSATALNFSSSLSQLKANQATSATPSSNPIQQPNTNTSQQNPQPPANTEAPSLFKPLEPKAPQATKSLSQPANPLQSRQSKNLSMISKASMSRLQNRELKQHQTQYIDNRNLFLKILNSDCEISIQQLWRIIGNFQHYDISQQKQQQFSKISADFRVFGIPTLENHPNWRALRRLIESVIFALKQEAMCNEMYSLEILNMLVGINLSNFSCQAYPWYRINEIEAYCISSVGNDYEINNRHPSFLLFLKEIMATINIQKITLMRIFQSIYSNEYVSELIGQQMRTCSQNIIQSIKINTNCLLEELKFGSAIQKQNAIVNISCALGCLLQIAIHRPEAIKDIKEYIQIVPRIVIVVEGLKDRAIEIAIRIMRLDEVVDTIVGIKKNQVTIVDRYREIFDDFTMSAIPYFKELLPGLSKAAGKTHKPSVTKIRKLSGSYWLSWFWLWLEGRSNMSVQELEHAGSLFIEVSRESYMDFWSMFQNNKVSNIQQLLNNLYKNSKDAVLLQILNNLSGNLKNNCASQLLASMKQIFNEPANIVLKQIFFRCSEKSPQWTQIVRLFCRIICLDIATKQTIEHIVQEDIYAVLFKWLSIDTKSIELTMELVNLFSQLFLKEREQLLQAIEQNDVSMDAIEGCNGQRNPELYLSFLELLNQHLKVNLVQRGNEHNGTNINDWLSQLLQFLQREHNIQISMEYVATIFQNYVIQGAAVRAIVDPVLANCRIDKLLSCIRMCNEEDRDELLVANRVPRHKHIVEIKQIIYGLRTVYICLRMIAGQDDELKLVREVQKKMLDGVESEQWLKTLMKLAGSDYFDGELVRLMKIENVSVLALKTLTMLLFLYMVLDKPMTFILDDQQFWNKIRRNLERTESSQFGLSVEMLIILSKISSKTFQNFCRQSKSIIDQVLFWMFKTDSIQCFASISTLLLFMSKCEGLTAVYRETIGKLVSGNLFQLAIQSYVEYSKTQLASFYSLLALHNVLAEIHHQMTSRDLSSDMQDIIHDNIRVLFNSQLISKMSQDLIGGQSQVDIHMYAMTANILHCINGMFQQNILYECYKLWHKLCTYSLFCNEIGRQTLGRAILIHEKHIAKTLIRYIDVVLKNPHDINLTIKLVIAAVSRLDSRELVIKCCDMIAQTQIDDKYGRTLVKMCCRFLNQVPESLQLHVRSSLDAMDNIQYALLPGLLTAEEAVGYAFKYMWSSNGATEPINFIICMRIITAGLTNGVTLTDRQFSALVRLIVDTSQQNIQIYEGQHRKLHQAWLWMLITARQLVLGADAQAIQNVRKALIARIINIKNALDAPQYSPLKKQYVDSYWLRYEIYLILCGILSLSTEQVVDFGGCVQGILRVISGRDILPISSSEVLQSAEVIKMMGITNYLDCLEISVGILWKIVRFGTLSSDFGEMLPRCLQQLCKTMEDMGKNRIQHEQLLKRAELWGRGKYAQADGYVSTTKCRHTVEEVVELCKIILREMIEISKEHIGNLKNTKDAHDFTVLLANTVRNLNNRYPYIVSTQDANNVLDSLAKHRRV